MNWIILAAALAILAPRHVHAEALLVIEADSGKVLQAENATMPWYPASVTKLMTAYVTLKAVKDGRITLDTLLTVSPVAASQSPSKMGFRPGTQVTVDNALKMMLVKSANDMAVVLAEGVGGSIDGFSAMMNQTAQRLGMTQTSYVNPNGLPADGQITSARDLAILARAIIRDLPEYEYFVHIPSIRYGRRVTQNFNKLIGRYPGADGFKTGFICASGYNLVASATRNGKRLIAVVLGASSGTMRAVRAAQLLDRGFANNTLVVAAALARHGRQSGADRCLAAEPARRDVRRQAQASGQRRGRGNRRRQRGSSSSGESGDDVFRRRPAAAGDEAVGDAGSGAGALGADPGLYRPDRTGAALIAAVAADTEKQTPRHARQRNRRSPAKKPDARGAENRSRSGKTPRREAEAPTKPAAVRACQCQAGCRAQAADKPAARQAGKTEGNAPSARPSLPRKAPQAKPDAAADQETAHAAHLGARERSKSGLSSISDASHARSRLPSAVALLNTPQNKASPSQRTGK